MIPISLLTFLPIRMEMKSKRIRLTCMTTVSKPLSIRDTIVPLLWEGPKFIGLKESEFQKKKREQKKGKHLCFLEISRQTVHM